MYVSHGEAVPIYAPLTEENQDVVVKVRLPLLTRDGYVCACVCMCVSVLVCNLCRCGVVGALCGSAPTSTIRCIIMRKHPSHSTLKPGGASFAFDVH